RVALKVKKSDVFQPCPIEQREHFFQPVNTTVISAYKHVEVIERSLYRVDIVQIGKIVMHKDGPSGSQTGRKIFENLCRLEGAIGMDDVGKQNQVEVFSPETWRQNSPGNGFNSFPCFGVRVEFTRGPNGIGKLEEHRAKLRPLSSQSTTPGSGPAACIEELAGRRPKHVLEIFKGLGRLEPSLNVQCSDVCQGPLAVLFRRFIH